MLSLLKQNCIYNAAVLPQQGQRAAARATPGAGEGAREAPRESSSCASAAAQQQEGSESRRAVVSVLLDSGGTFIPSLPIDPAGIVTAATS
jgi:hypothetical protein